MERFTHAEFEELRNRDHDRLTTAEIEAWLAIYKRADELIAQIDIAFDGVTLDCPYSGSQGGESRKSLCDSMLAQTSQTCCRSATPVDRKRSIGATRAIELFDVGLAGRSCFSR